MPPGHANRHQVVAIEVHRGIESALALEMTLVRRDPGLGVELQHL